MDVKNFRFKDKDGNVLYEFPITGVAPDITVSASVDNNVGTPSVTVTKSGENDAPTYNLDFKNLKGDTGSQGVQGVQGVQGPPVPIDTTLSTTSNNAIANSTVTTEFNKIDNIIASTGRIYNPSTLTTVSANQVWSTLSSILLPQGVYVVTASAKHSSTSVCDISISKSPSSVGWCKQIIYGNRTFDVNAGSISTIVEMPADGIIYFTTWGESDFEITPMSFIATRI